MGSIRGSITLADWRACRQRALSVFCNICSASVGDTCIKVRGRDRGVTCGPHDRRIVDRYLEDRRLERQRGQ